jgi:hypothetical protein
LRDASVRAMVEALLVKRFLGGCVESVLTSATHRLLLAGFFSDGIRPFLPGSESDPYDDGPVALGKPPHQTCDSGARVRVNGA